MQQQPAHPGALEGEVDTPALLLDLDMFEANLDRMAGLAATAGVSLRPHAKTHKSTVIAHHQTRRGAIGQCVQKVAEAEALAWGGVENILVTNQIVDRGKLLRLSALTSIARISVCVDTIGQVALIEDVAATMGIRIDTVVEIDVGARRCGIAPGQEAAALARRIATSRHLSFGGLQAYNGSAQHLRRPQQREAAVDAVVHGCVITLEQLSKAGIDCPMVSGAGTGTFELEAKSGVYTEIQPGSYCFMDADYSENLDEDGNRVGTFGQALFVLASVISTPRPGMAILDTGHKAFAMDRGLPLVAGRSDMRIISASDEHARMELASSSDTPQIGEKFRLVPGHCDPTVDRFDWYVGVRNGRVEHVWPVSARGGFY